MSEIIKLTVLGTILIGIGLLVGFFYAELSADHEKQTNADREVTKKMNEYKNALDVAQVKCNARVQEIEKDLWLLTETEKGLVSLREVLD